MHIWRASFFLFPVGRCYVSSFNLFLLLFPFETYLALSCVYSTGMAETRPFHCQRMPGPWISICFGNDGSRVRLCMHSFSYLKSFQQSCSAFIQTDAVLKKKNGDRQFIPMISNNTVVSFLIRWLVSCFGFFFLYFISCCLVRGQWNNNSLKNTLRLEFFDSG